MSKVERTKLYGWSLLIGGFVILILTATMNYLQGDYIGVTWQGKLVNSMGSVAVDIVGLVVCGLAAGACFANKRWVWGSIFAVAVLGSAAWSANSMISFQATERMSASKQRADMIERDKQADKLLVDDYKWKRDSAVRRADTRTERKDYLASAESSIKAYRNTKVEARVEPDAGARLWSVWTGRPMETVQLTQAAYFGFLMILLKMICFPGSGYMLSWSPGGGAVANGKSGQQDSGGSDGNGKVVQLHKSEPSTAALPASRNSTSSASESAAQSAASTRRSDRPVASITPVQLPWPKADVDAYLAEVAGRPNRQTWRDMGHMMGWDHTTLFKRWQRSTGVNKGQRRPVLGGHRIQHRVGRTGGLHAPI